MLLPSLSITCILLGVFSIFLSYRNIRFKKILKERDEMAKRRVYEISTLKAIQDRISYSLNIEHVIDTLTSSLKSLFPYSTASSLLLQEDKVIFKIYLEERVSNSFVEQVQKAMLASFATASGNSLPSQIEEVRQGVVADDTNKKILASFFNVPLVVNGKVVALINVSSTTPGLYKEADMTIMYQMATQASNALTKLQEVIATEEGKLIAMIGSLTDGIIMVDNNFVLDLINDTARNLLGISKTSPSFLDCVSVLSKEGDFAQEVQRAMRQNITVTKPEILLGERIVEIIVTPVTGPSENTSATLSNKQVLGVAITLRDITLEKSVNKLKEDFTASIVHELRSPLTAIKASAELIETEKEKLDEIQQSKLIQVIYQQSERMLHDINSLLDAAKLESGHFTLFQKLSDAQDVIAQAIELFRAEAGKKHIEISIEAENDLPKGFFDPTRIQQVLDNLLSNSLKFTPDGGNIVVHARKYNNEYLPVSPTNPGILIAISDTGIGIPIEKQGTLFSKFSQVQNIGYIHGAQGTGLGLYISKGIVESHGGQIFLQSIPGHGTTVSFTLPIAKPIGVEKEKSQEPTTSLPQPLIRTVN